MADLNTIYAGVLEYFDPKGDSGILNPSTRNWFGGGGSNFWLEEMGFWPQLDKINKDSASTIAAVKVAYDSSQKRVQFLRDRIGAIDNRVSFIKARTLDILESLKGQGADAYDVLMKGFTSALGLVPVVGSVVTYAVGKESERNALEAYKLQRLVQDYTGDLEQLSLIRAQFVKELAASADATEEEKKDPQNEAPFVIPTWWYYAGGVAIMLLFIWLAKRKKKGRKR